MAASHPIRKSTLPVTHRFKLTVAYDGARFAGWQSQVGGNTVQDAIESALAIVGKTPINLHGSGRTDAGVHALGQIAHFDAPAGSNLAAETWVRALNSSLPPSIRILRAAQVPSSFHARFSARGKVYRYELWTGSVLPPHLFQRTWHVPQGVDDDSLRRALELFVGEHDFRPFSANRGTPATNTVRRISRIHCTRAGDSLKITFQGNGFLYKMVRMLTGAAVKVALGREDERALRDLLASPGSGRWTHVAPADGLYLVRVVY
jgi:tRNA pseudouridine38-40 synthase